MVIIALGLADCGGGGDEVGALVWERGPQVFTPETLPGDRVLTGTIRNDSLEAVELTASDLTLRDDDGDRVEGSAVFLAGFAHGLNPPTRAPDPLPEFERRRTGQEVLLEPDDTPVPLTLSWHQPRNSDPPVAIDYGTGSLPIPTSQ